MRKFLLDKGILKCFDNMLLTDYVVKALRTVYTVQSLICHYILSF